MTKAEARLLYHHGSRGHDALQGLDSVAVKLGKLRTYIDNHVGDESVRKHVREVIDTIGAQVEEAGSHAFLVRDAAQEELS